MDKSYSKTEPPDTMDPPDPQLETQRSVSPVGSCDSMKSDGSRFEPLDFSSGPPQPHPKLQTPRSVSPVASCVSMKSDGSRFEPLDFSSGSPQPHPKLQTPRPVSPVGSCVSMKSDGSRFEPLDFRSGPPQPHPKLQTPRSVSPVASCVSMKSDGSRFEPLDFSSGSPQPHPKLHSPRSVSPVPSCVSMKSDCSKGNPPKFSSESPQSDPVLQTPRAVSPVPSCVSMKSDGSRFEPLDFGGGPPQPHPKLHSPRSVSPVPSCVSMKSDCSKGNPPKFSSESPQSDPVTKIPSSAVQNQSRCGLCEKSVSVWSQSGPSEDYTCPQCRMRCRSQPSTNPDTTMSQPPSPSPKGSTLTDSHNLNEVRKRHKAKMKQRFENICEGIIRPGAQTLLNKIYTELYITEGESEGVNKEHEVWQVEAASRPQTTDDTAINCNDIFKPLGQNRDIRTVMTKGIAGIGKTVSVQKFILDWSEEKANQNVDFMFVLPFRELNLVKHDQYSLHRLLLDFHPELKRLENAEYRDSNIVFIFDGLDESRLPLRFQENEKLSNVSDTASVDVLMTSLIQGHLLPSAQIWITSRPAAANQIPCQWVHLVTEVRGFNDPQKEEYFRKRISNQKEANTIISHIKTTSSLHIMCHIPVFCWIVATVLQSIQYKDKMNEAPKTLTEMFIHFLRIQTTRKDQKYQEVAETDGLLASHKDVILKLAELAFTHLDNGNLMFYEEDLVACGIDVSEASVYSGMCTEIFREECVFGHKRVYCFVHLSIQEFLAALHVFSSYLNNNEEVLGYFLKRKATDTADADVRLDELLDSAVNKALESKNGHLDLFVRFLHGISLDSNQRLLLGLISHAPSPGNLEKIIMNLKQKLTLNVSAERCINVLHCLAEIRDHSFHDEILTFLKEEDVSKKFLEVGHCSAVAYMFSVSNNVMNEFDPKKYSTSPEGRRRLIPIVRCCRKAMLSHCGLTETCCETVGSALQSVNSHLCVLDLSNNDLKKSGGKLMSALQSPNCKLETLRMSGCNLTEASYEIVASVLQSANSFLRELDLSDNDLQKSGEKLLSPLPHTKLERLRMTGCNLTEASYEIVASALQSANSPLRELDLSDNDLQKSGEKLLSPLPHSKLERLRLAGCKLTEMSCKIVAFALQSENSLRQLDLSHNDLQKTVEKLVSALQSPNCKLEALRLASCNLTDESTEVVVSALQSMTFLRELDLGDNHMSVSGVQLLCKTLGHHNCKLQILRLAGCKLTEQPCESIASAVQPCIYLEELDLSGNYMNLSGIQCLNAVLHRPNLQILRYHHGENGRIKPELRKYACELTLDPNTVNYELTLSEGNRKLTWVSQKQQYPDHPDRFDYRPQVLCREGLSGRCYWEVEWGNPTSVAVAYKSINRKGDGHDTWFGMNDKSWRLNCHKERLIAWHHGIRTDIPAPTPRSSRVGVYLDWPAGTLSFYSVSSDTLTHLHTFHSKFTEPLYPGFRVYNSSVSLCQITHHSTGTPESAESSNTPLQTAV